MARLARLTVPGQAHYVIQRGNDRQVIVRSDDDRRQLLALFAEYAARGRVAIHSYVLMDNHFHLLATPPDAHALSTLMQAVGRRYVQSFNRGNGRTGALWEGRFRASPVQAEIHVLACMLFIDLDPVRAGLVARAVDYRWSSHGHYVGLQLDSLVTPHPCYWQLGNTPFAREACYAERVARGISADQQGQIAETVLKGWALGEASFLNGLQMLAPRRVIRGRPGRPPSVRPA